MLPLKLKFSIQNEYLALIEYHELFKQPTHLFFKYKKAQKERKFF